MTPSWLSNYFFGQQSIFLRYCVDGNVRTISCNRRTILSTDVNNYTGATDYQVFSSQ